ncbi:MAG: N-acetylglucosamine-6-phosphate deacetylase [Planctomycetaceae bacterium]|nr:N-acetylglucosamine-6-phosphate deacetylase [Planctomycetaceae bacterium]
MKSPGYVDLQINGYAGIDFNQDELTLDQLQHVCATLEQDGVAGILATVITDSVPAMRARIERLVRLRHEDPAIENMVWGIHIEGPFISPVPGYVGAHPREHACQATWDAMAMLLDAAEGLTRIVTLAPEQDPGQVVTRKLARQNIIVAAGHTNASLDQLNACIDQGLSLFTHLGNGCPMQMHRHDNIIQRALSRADALYFSFIADGAHVPFFALRNYLKIAGLERSVVVTDAISAAGCGPGRFRLGGQTIDVGDDGVPRSLDNSHLVGSGTPMNRMAQNLAEHLGLTPGEIAWLTRHNPLQLLNSAEPPSGILPVSASTTPA